MQTNNKIRIIKRSERDLPPAGQALSNEKLASEGKDAVVTIKGWIGELQQKKRDEASASVRALKSLQVKAA